MASRENYFVCVIHLLPGAFSYFDYNIPQFRVCTAIFHMHNLKGADTVVQLLSKHSGETHHGNHIEEFIVKSEAAMEDAGRVWAYEQLANLEDWQKDLQKQAREYAQGVKGLPLRPGDSSKVEINTMNMHRWQVLRQEAEDFCSQFGFLGVSALARMFECSKSTMHKVIKKSGVLSKFNEERKARSSPRRASRLSHVTIDISSQSCELNPAKRVEVEDFINRLRQNAVPKELEWINKMNFTQHAKLIDFFEDDPKKYHQMWGRNS